MSNLVFASKDPSEVDDRGLDFSALLETGETLTGTPSVTVTVLTGTDASPSSLLSGSATIEGTVVWQRYTGGTAGVTYRCKYSVATSTSRTLIACGLLRVEAC
jgi:hypothetical protein